MTVLIDDAIWWRGGRVGAGRRWCHLVSDSSLDELHDFARRHGIPVQAFEGDHYDIPEERRDTLIAAGAVVVESRELVQRLRGAGLLLTPAERRTRHAR